MSTGTRQHRFVCCVAFVFLSFFVFCSSGSGLSHCTAEKGYPPLSRQAYAPFPCSNRAQTSFRRSVRLRRPSTASYSVASAVFLQFDCLQIPRYLLRIPLLSSPIKSELYAEVPLANPLLSDHCKSELDGSGLKNMEASQQTHPSFAIARTWNEGRRRMKR